MRCSVSAPLRWLALLPTVLATAPACFLFEETDRSYSSLATDPDPVDENEPPRVTIVAPTDGVVVAYGEEVRFTSVVVDADDNVPEAGVSWVSDLAGELGTGFELTAGTLESGVHTVTVTAVDLAGASASDEVVVNVLPESYAGENLPPEVEILVPALWQVFQEAGEIPLSGDGTDPEEGPLADDALRWRLFLDDETPLEANGRDATLDLPTGTYDLVLKGTDPWGAYDQAVVPFVVGPFDACTVAAPVVTPDNLVLAPGGEGSFSVSTPRWDAYPASLVLGSLEDGADPVDTVLAAHEVNFLTVLSNAGLDRIFDVTARLDVASGATWTIDVLLLYTTLGHPELAPMACRVALPIRIEGSANRAPTATIQSPDSGAVFYPDEAVTFEGEGVDPEEGALAGASLVWETIREGVLGTGASLTTTGPATGWQVGEHILMLTATDGPGLFDVATTRFSIYENFPPEVTITSPSDGGTVAAGDPVTMTGTATDLHEGTLSGASLTWSSDRDGVLGTGATLTRTDLGVGAHVLTLTAVDERGASATSSVAIQVEPAGAGTGTITGSVAVLIDGEPRGWRDVLVTLSGAASATTTTDASGGFSFSALPSGTFTVSISGFPSYLSFPATSQTVTLVAGGTIDVSFVATTGE